MHVFIISFLACFPEISPTEEERFPENPRFDYDDDGFDDATDCDDSNPEVGLPTWFYMDADGDGFGVQGDAEFVCPNEKQDNYIETVLRDGVEVFDCNDGDTTINPDELEVCDDVDNDCNGDVDELDGLESKRWYKDNDGDGYGYFDTEDEDSVVYSCTGYPGLVQNILDCDDENVDINPGAIEQCDDVDNNCNGQIDEPTAEGVVKWYRDADLDGYGSDVIFVESCEPPEGYISRQDGQAFDCNDNDQAIYPGAVEVCDSVDNNCNVLIDEGADSTAPADASTFYADFDGDGFGNANITTVQCSEPSGYVSNIDDCDDTNDQVHPNADEYCNTVDDNCNQQIDEGSASTAPVDAPTWYVDLDGDLAGSTAMTILQCSQPIGYVDNMDDCDDADVTLNAIDTDGDGLSTCDGDCNDADPSASSGDMDGDGQTSCNGDCDDSNAAVYLGAPELCNNFQDDDCDGQIDEADAVDKTEWFEDLDGDGFGNGGVSQFACTAPTDFVVQLGDCNDSDAMVSPGAIEICDSVDNNCDGLIDDADANLDLNTATEFYRDDDVDGQGDEFNSTFRCLMPPGFVINSDDCDDTNPVIYTGADEYCNGLDDDCDGTEDESAEDAIEYYVDADEDGHGVFSNTPTEVRCPEYDVLTSLPLHPAGLAPTNDDCDDSDAAISPSADELCTNNIDENCDTHMTAGATDVSTFLVDADGDNFGSGERTTNGDLAYALDLCIQPYGYIEYDATDPTMNQLDCDDGDFDTKPGAIELCNGKRDNCPSDGSSSVPNDEWDDDGDGFIECVIDSSFLFNSDGTVNGWNNNQPIYDGFDCDDSDADRYPFALEKCNGIYDRCNDANFSEIDSPILEEDFDGDGYVECEGFDSNNWFGDVSVLGGGDCNDSSVITYPGAANLTDPNACLSDSDGDGYADRLWSICPVSQSLNDARYTLLGESPYSDTGFSASIAGDVDGDGLDDILIGAYQIGSSNGSSIGKVYLILGSSLGSTGVLDLANADYIFEGEVGYDRLGLSISMSGDVDGDGLDDILMGAYNNDDGGTNAGKTYLILGSSLGSSGLFNLSNADYAFVGEEPYDYSGSTVSMGDIDGDGLSDILIGAYGHQSNGVYSGKTYLILGSSLGSTGVLELVNADYQFEGENASDYSGSALSFGGDVDGDGLSDILIGAYGNSDSIGAGGKTYLILSSSLDGLNAPNVSLAVADFIFTGEGLNDHSGYSLSLNGDVDGDGLADILIGAPKDGSSTAPGKSYLVLGSGLDFTVGQMSLSNAEYVFQGQARDNAGIMVSLGGDIDNDGLDEVFISSKDNGSNATSESYIVLGISLGGSSTIDLVNADYSFVTDDDGFNSTMTISSMGDLDGDGNVEVMTSMPYNDASGIDAGMISIFSACEN